MQDLLELGSKLKCRHSVFWMCNFCPMIWWAAQWAWIKELKINQGQPCKTCTKPSFLNNVDVFVLQMYSYDDRPKGRTKQQILAAVDSLCRLSIGDLPMHFRQFLMHQESFLDCQDRIRRDFSVLPKRRALRTFLKMLFLCGSSSTRHFEARNKISCGPNTLCSSRPVLAQTLETKILWDCQECKSSLDFF